MLKNRHFVTLSVGWLVGRSYKWLLPSSKDERGWTELYSGKKGMVRAGGSASPIIGDRSATDPGGGMWTRGGGQLGNNNWGTPVDIPGTQMSRPFRH